VRRHTIIASIAIGTACAYVAICRILTAGTSAPPVSDETLATIVAGLPPGFLLGTATSAHQIEGGNERNDWALFEALPGKIANGEKSGKADDHWNRVAEDIDLMKRLGTNAYRFSVEWSRVEPSEGTWDEGAWAHYRDEVNRLNEAGIAPMVTLLHFTLPAWMAERGGLTSPDFPQAFARFAEEASSRLGAEVKQFCTLNEPNVAMYNGYVLGNFPPGQKSNGAAVAAFAGMLRAHAAAARALRVGSPKASVGLAINLVAFEPKNPYNLLDDVATRIASDAYDWAFLESLKAGRIRFSAPGFPSIDEPCPDLAGSLDFIGVNYYRRDVVSFAPGRPGMLRNEPGDGDRTDLDWEIHPQGLLRLLREVSRRYKLPIIVTENGIADAKGNRRASFIQQHLGAISTAAREGIDVRGYFHWSLLDNFEWADGFAPRFGLYRVDYASLSRTSTPGAEMFSRVAEALHSRNAARR
jgi:beta-glucosidase